MHGFISLFSIDSPLANQAEALAWVRFSATVGFGQNEAIAFGVVKPLYSSLFH
jgi:hypothetical protein